MNGSLRNWDLRLRQDFDKLILYDFQAFGTSIFRVRISHKLEKKYRILNGKTEELDLEIQKVCQYQIDASQLELNSWFVSIYKNQ